MIELHKEIDFESQIEHILKQGEIELANKLFTIQFKGSWNQNAVQDERWKLDANIGWTLFFQKFEFGTKSIRALENAKIDIWEVII